MYDEEKWAKADADLQGAFVGVSGLMEGIRQDSQHYLLYDNELLELSKMEINISNYIDRLELLRKRAEKRWQAAEKRRGKPLN